MANELQWLFKILDNLTAPAERMAASIEKLEIALTKTSGKLDSIDTSTKKAATSSDFFSLKLNAAFEIASKVGTVLLGAASAAVDFGLKTLHAAAGAERLNLSLKQVLGAEGAKEIGSFLERVGKTSAFSPDQLKQAIIPLARAGFKGEDLERALAASEDLAQGDLSRFNEALFAFQKISLKGGIDDRALINLGVRTKDFYASLGKVQGVSEKAAEKMAGEGKIKPDVLIGVLEQAIAKSEGGTLGNRAVEFGGTLKSILDRLAAIPEDYLQKFSESSAFEPVKQFLSNLTKLLGPDGEFGQRAITAVGEVFSALFGGVTTDNATQRASQFVEGVVSLIEKIPPFVKQARETFDTWIASAGGLDSIIGLLSGVGSIVGNIINLTAVLNRITAPFSGFLVFIVSGVIAGVANILNAITTLAVMGIRGIQDLMNFVGNFLDVMLNTSAAIILDLLALPGKIIAPLGKIGLALLDLPSQFFEAGKDMISGLIDGMKSLWSSAVEFPKQLGGAVVDAFKMTLGIASPSTVFRALGENTVAGYVEGIDRMADRAADATAGLGVGLAPPGAGAAGAALLGGGSSTYTFNFGDIVIDGTETEGPDQARELASRLRGAVQSELEGMFQRMAIEQGVG